METHDAQLAGGALLEFQDDDTSTTRILERANGQDTIVRSLMSGHVPVWNPALMFDPEKVRELGLSYPTQRYCDDLLFMARMVFGGATVHNTNEPTVYYRKHPQSITTGWNPQNALWYGRAMRQVWAESPLEPTFEDKAHVAARAILYLGLSDQGQPYKLIRNTYHTFRGNRSATPTSAGSGGSEVTV
jgi:hypothetical protein